MRMLVENLLKDTEEQMKKALAHSQQSLQRIRAGRATPDMLSHLRVDYYGTSTPLTQVSSITNPNAQSLHIKPWEKDLIPEIERAVQQSDLGLTPQNNGEAVILNIPPLSEERRKQVLKQAKQEAEQGRIRIRNLRKESNEALKKDETLSEDESKQASTQVQALTDKYIGQLDEHLAAKEKEIMQI